MRLCSNYRYPDIRTILPIEKQLHNYNRWRKAVHRVPEEDIFESVSQRAEFISAIEKYPSTLFYSMKVDKYDTYYRVVAQTSKKFVIFADLNFLQEIRSALQCTLYIVERSVGPAYFQKLITFFLRVETAESQQVIK